MAYPPCVEDVQPSALDVLVADPQPTGDGSTVNFILTGAAGLPAEQFVISVDGLLQTPIVDSVGDFSVADDGADAIVTFASAPADGAVMSIRAFR